MNFLLVLVICFVHLELVNSIAFSNPTCIIFRENEILSYRNRMLVFVCCILKDIYSKDGLCGHPTCMTFRENEISSYLYRMLVFVCSFHLPLFLRVNISSGGKEDRMMMTGLHTVADIFCVGCGSIVGWKYEFAHEKNQKYKEGKSVLER
ncbi:Protein yippee-like [Hibiscus syriacus]|uniref:Protein yippee-like n=1 Tax=Hibiscus syriacus TaxID=106335 RepID=A0A6A2Z0A3_HIBSY|nr:Protein yippee-like [Hibiscus syriacus]